MISFTLAKPNRLGSLRRFATTSTILTICGHIFLGFEMSYAVPVAALLTAYATQIFLEWVRAVSYGQKPLFAGGMTPFVNFLLPAHIIALTCAAFLYPGQRLEPIVFAVVLSVASKMMFRVHNEGSRHFINPSNLGVLATLVFFPQVGIFLPYQFHSGIGNAGDVILPLLLACAGVLINARFTGRLPLIIGWLAAFVIQAAARALFLDTNFLSVAAAATGTAAMLFTFFMISDPGTTPRRTVPQLVFGSAIGLIYGVLMAFHVVYGLFLALFLVTLGHGAYLFVTSSGANNHNYRKNGAPRASEQGPNAHAGAA
jgi:hypothetical protein